MSELVTVIHLLLDVISSGSTVGIDSIVNNKYEVTMESLMQKNPEHEYSVKYIDISINSFQIRLRYACDEENAIPYQFLISVEDSTDLILPHLKNDGFVFLEDIRGVLAVKLETGSENYSHLIIETRNGTKYISSENYSNLIGERNGSAMRASF